MPKICIATDPHLSFSSQFDRMGSTGVSNRLQEILDSLKWAADAGKAKKATYFFGLGDIFDKPERLPTKEGIEIQKVFKYISDTYKNKCGLLTGNHDKISQETSILDLFSSTIPVFNKVSFLDVDGARLFFIPYILSLIHI